MRSRRSSASGSRRSSTSCRPDRHVDVVAADNEPAGDGRRGARELVERLRGCVRRIQLLLPDAKDLRERVAAGLTAGEFAAAVR